jgi:hypothetical protein
MGVPVIPQGASISSPSRVIYANLTVVSSRGIGYLSYSAPKNSENQLLTISQLRSILLEP